MPRSRAPGSRHSPVSSIGAWADADRLTPIGSRPATVDDIHEIARSLPGVTLGGARGKLSPTVYQGSRRSFLFFRNPRRDAVDPDTGKRYTNVIGFWVESELVAFRSLESLVHEFRMLFEPIDFVGDLLRCQVRGRCWVPLSQLELSPPVWTPFLNSVGRSAQLYLVKGRLLTSATPLKHPVKSHPAHIFTKLEVDDRTAAVTVALDRGMIRSKR